MSGNLDAEHDEPRDGAAVRRQGEGKSTFEIVAREDFSDVTYLLEISHPALAKAAKPGQFVIVIPHEHGERIPLTIADFDRAAGTITLVIQAVGKTTKEIQRSFPVGSALFGVVGRWGRRATSALSATVAR